MDGSQKRAGRAYGLLLWTTTSTHRPEATTAPLIESRQSAPARMRSANMAGLLTGLSTIGLSGLRS